MKRIRVSAADAVALARVAALAGAAPEEVTAAALESFARLSRSEQLAAIGEYLTQGETEVRPCRGLVQRLVGSLRRWLFGEACGDPRLSQVDHASRGAITLP